MSSPNRFVEERTLFCTGSTGLNKISLTQRPQDPKGISWNQLLTKMMNFPGDLPISVYQCASVVEYCLFLFTFWTRSAGLKKIYSPRRLNCHHSPPTFVVLCSVAKHLLQSVIPEDGNLTISATEGMASAMPKAHAQLPSPNKKTTNFLFQVCCPERSRGESVP